MYNFDQLSDDEIRYICERMHIPSVRYYFQKYPKEFNKIRPGFTVKKMTDDEIIKFLVKYARKPFVMNHIQHVVTQWLSQIQENLDMLEQQGYTVGEALLQTIPDSYFNDWYELYFKIAELTNDERYFKLFGDALALIKRLSESDTENTGSETDTLQQEIAQLKEQLAESSSHESELQSKLDAANELLCRTQEKLEVAETEQHKCETALSEYHIEIERYHRLARYEDNDVDFSAFEGFQHTSIGQIIIDYNEQVWILRLADILPDGSITKFISDEYAPRYFSNRDRLYWRNGPDSENTIGVWNWNATPRDTDPEKDFVKTDFCYTIKLIQIIVVPNCESLDELSTALSNGIECSVIFDKALFVYSNGSCLSGLLCSSKDYEYIRGSVTLKQTTFTLPQYSIKSSDTIDIAGVCIYNNIKLGIPQSVCQIRTPYEGVKSLLLSRFTNAALREYELSKKEVSNCRRFLQAIPTDTIIQEIINAYGCSEKEAQELIEGFITHADTYLLSTDIDSYIVSRAIYANPELIELCKKQLTSDWEKENSEQINAAQKEISDIQDSLIEKQEEVSGLANDRDKLLVEVDALRSELSKREQLASEVEEKIATQIEKAKQDASDFISNMAFISPIASQSHSTQQITSPTITPYKSVIDCEDSGDIDDHEAFCEELSENLELFGYNEDSSIEIAQAICFAIFERIPLIISENAKKIAQCIAALVNNGALLDIFISDPSTSIETLSESIIGSDNSKPAVYLIHGVFDSYSISLFNALSNLMQIWNKNVIILLSLEGISAHMISNGVWNHSIYIDGDTGFESCIISTPHSFNLSFDMSIPVSCDTAAYKKSRKQLMPFSEVLSNTQICLYAKYLAIHSISINESTCILEQMVVTARSIGAIERLNELFHENGISNGEEMTKKYI